MYVHVCLRIYTHQHQHQAVAFRRCDVEAAWWWCQSEALLQCWRQVINMYAVCRVTGLKAEPTTTRRCMYTSLLLLHVYFRWWHFEIYFTLLIHLVLSSNLLSIYTKMVNIFCILYLIELAIVNILIVQNVKLSIAQSN